MKLMFLVKIAAFILLAWRRSFNSIKFPINKYLNENSSVVGKLNIRTYRLLRKHKKDTHSSIVEIKEEIPYNIDNKNKHIRNNEEEDTSRNKKSYRSSLNNGGSHIKDKKNKFCTFETKKYSHLEKKIFKELDYENFLKNNRIISNKFYKKIMFKKYRLRLSLPLLFFLFLSISLILDLFVNYGVMRILRYLLNTYGNSAWNTLGKKFGELIGKDWCYYLRPFFTAPQWANGNVKGKVYASTGLIGLIIYFLPFIILGVTVISGIIYYHRKVKKYEKIKLKKR
ncbi:fam-l protein [Plasmodium malariae]|uniref:Fam-l protein n=1 Tax=Plasmodium malariae TaxID=5858 RepID=A0A1D3TDR5_PLAMA|nr:fam-l protein [Plasmodium malariae]SCP02955.1 fam-l protein [Plasmodium malariae]